MSNINVVRKNLGPVTAYKYAVQQGYTGTEQEFAALMASYATVAEEAESAKDDAIDAKTAAEEAQAAAEAAAESLEIDDTLTQTGQAADAGAVGDEINNLKDDLSATTGNRQIEFVSGGYIKLSDATADINNIVATAQWRHAVITCVEGDRFTVSGSGGSAPRMWGFVSSDGTVLSVANASTTVDGIALTAPADSVYLILNDNSGATSYYGVLVKNQLVDITDNLETITSDSRNLLTVEWRNARYNNGVYQALNTGISYAAAVPIMPVNGGDTYTLVWSSIPISTGSYAVYIHYIDSTMTFVESVSNLYRTYGAQSLALTTPANARYVAITVYSQDAVWSNVIPDNMMLVSGTDLPDVYIPPIVLNPDMYDPDRIVDIIDDSNSIGRTMYTNHTRNVFSGVWEAARYTNGVYGYRNQDYIATRPTTPVQPDTMYSVTWGDNVVNAGQFYIVEFADNGDYIDVKSTPYKNHILQFRTDAQTAFLGFQLYYSGGNLENLIPDYIQVEIGFPTEYVKPYAVQNRDVDFYELTNIHNNVNIPSYYFADNYLIDKISRIKDLMEKYVANGDALIFITDEHWEINQRHSPSLINYIKNHVNLKCLVSGGDTANTVSADFCEKLRKAFDRDIYHVVGNHDWFVPATSSMIFYHMHMYNNGLRGNGKDHYYYYDNTLQKIRYIVLNAFTAESGSDNSTSYVSGYKQEQIDWFTTLLTASDGYNIIVLTHFVGANDTTSLQGIATIRNAIDAHNASSTNGKVLAVLQGHTHYDGIYSTDAGVPIITTTCDKNKPYISGGIDTEPWLNDRVAGTIYEQAFDVDIIDITNSCIYAVRVGAPVMNNYKASSETGFVIAMTAEERIVHYDAVHISGDESLSAVITADAWGCSNTNICTVSDGVVHPVAIGKTYVYATNADGQLEIWIIIVD